MKDFWKLTGMLAISIAFSGCGQREDGRPDVSLIDAPVKIDRLEDSLFACRSAAEVLVFLRQHKGLAAVYFPDYPLSDSLLAAELYRNISNPVLRLFKDQVDSVFADLDSEVRVPLENAFRYVKYYYPDFRIPKVQTMVTGFMGNDLYVSDSLIAIGLDYFGGPGARFRPDVFDYQLRRYRKEYVVPSILFFLSQKYNRVDPEDKTLLADMIWYGKGFEFVKRMAPEVADSLVIGFSEHDLRRSYNSQTEIWAYFISNRLLYETTVQKKQKYVGERPFTFEIGEDVPGGIGRWLGWRIASVFLAENPKVTLQEFMASSNARVILEQSGYKGQTDE